MHPLYGNLYGSPKREIQGLVLSQGQAGAGVLGPPEAAMGIERGRLCPRATVPQLPAALGLLGCQNNSFFLHSHFLSLLTSLLKPFSVTVSQLPAYVVSTLAAAEGRSHGAKASHRQRGCAFSTKAQVSWTESL